MPYSKEHKESTRQKILDSAVTLFATQGFDQVSIDDLMNHAGLTRGAFYAHFKNKKELYSKSMIVAARNSRIVKAEKPIDMSQEEWIIDLLSGYLSEEHINQIISPCPLAFLVTDIANKETEVQATYTRMYKLINKTIQAQLNENPEIKEENVLATTAMMIGSVAIGRALNDKEMTRKLLGSARKASIELLGLDKN